MPARVSETLINLESLVRKFGLEFFGVSALGPEAHFMYFSSWLERGGHAGMEFLTRYQECRADPSALLPGSKTAIIVGLNYYLGDKWQRKSFDMGALAPRVAQYARLRDYHKVLKRQGEAVLAELFAQYQSRSDTPPVGRVVVDSAPILERALAAKAGSGFVGKNTCFIDPQRGSFYLLGELLTSLPLRISDVPPIDHAQRTASGGCGTCQRCQVNCPTGALDKAYSLDANKCLAYWTIEHRGTIPENFWPWLKYYFFGCDICQLVCPYNRKAKHFAAPELLKLHSIPSLYAIATMTQTEYEAMFAGTPMTRAKREGLIRNALIAMTVTADAKLDDAVGIASDFDDLPVVLATLAQIRRYRAG